MHTSVGVVLPEQRGCGWANRDAGPGGVVRVVVVGTGGSAVEGEGVKEQGRVT